MRFFKNPKKCVLNSVWYCEIPLTFSLEKVNLFAWNGVANFGHGGHFCPRFVFKRKVHHIVPCLQGQRGLVWWSWNTTKRSLEKVALAREKFPSFCDKTNKQNFSTDTRKTGQVYAHSKANKICSLYAKLRWPTMQLHDDTKIGRHYI